MRQRQKKQSTLTPKTKRPKEKTVLFVESTVHSGTTTMEGIRLALATVIAELNYVPDLQIIPN